jgi:hypothetical protein
VQVFNAVALRNGRLIKVMFEIHLTAVKKVLKIKKNRISLYGSLKVLTF